MLYVLICMNTYNGIIASLSPLHTLQKGDLNAVKVLVAFGASVNATNNRGQTPLDLATVGYLNQEQELSLSLQHCSQPTSHGTKLERELAKIPPPFTERVHCCLELF